MNRRGFITGLISLVAAPAIVRAGSLMPVKSFVLEDGVALSFIPYPGDLGVYGDVLRVLERCEKLMLQTTAVYGGYLNPN